MFDGSLPEIGDLAALDDAALVDVWREGVVPHARRGDHEIRIQLAAVNRPYLPSGSSEHRRDDLGVQPKAIIGTEPVDDVAQVALDLVAGREQGRPVRFRRERELVELRRDVTSGRGSGSNATRRRHRRLSLGS
jgi:hypothetical protein